MALNMKYGSVFVFILLAILSGQISSAPLTKSDEVTPTTTNGDITEHVTDNQATDEDFAKKYLEKYGYSKSGITKNSYNSKYQFKDSIKQMQKFFNLNVTGELDNKTLEVIRSPRCSLPDIITGVDRRKKRYVLYGKWYTSYLSYRIDNYPTYSDFNSLKDVETAIDDGVQEWTKYTNLQLTKTQSIICNIKIGFYSGNHGDGNPFDGRGNVLAHAFYPPDGRLHFDNDENWSKSDYGYNLELVAAHEAGHIFGLMHSNVASSIMYPIYRYTKVLMLSDDDIRGIQSLYGYKPYVTQIPPTTTTPYKFNLWTWIVNIFRG